MAWYKMSSKVDVVIPARNEELTIGPILHMLNMHPAIGNIIVSVDGETIDETAAKARLCGANVVESGFWGKGQVVKAGLDEVTSEFVMFCDADYRGFSYTHITEMTRILDYRFTTIGVPEYPEDVPDRVIASWPWVSGIRLVLTDIARSVDLHGYLMEVQINKATYVAGKRFRFRFLPGLISQYKMSDKRIAEMRRDRKWGEEHAVF